MRLSRFLPRFSLRTLLLLTLLVGSGVTVWSKREPWVLETTLETSVPYFEEIRFAPDSRRIALHGNSGTFANNTFIEVWDCGSPQKLCEVANGWRLGSPAFSSD